MALQLNALPIHNVRHSGPSMLWASYFALVTSALLSVKHKLSQVIVRTKWQGADGR